MRTGLGVGVSVTERSFVLGRVAKTAVFVAGKWPARKAFQDQKERIGEKEKKT
jgi:hypothetical protein